jgi:hypothetical protein
MFFIPPDSDTFTQYIAQWDGSSWSALGKGVNDFIHALAVDNQGHLFAAGNFMEASGAPASHIAMWDGSSWNALGSGIGIPGDYSSVSSLAIDPNGGLYVGGGFTIAGMKASANIARWDSHLEAAGKTAGVTLTETEPASTPTPPQQIAQLTEVPKINTITPAFTPIATQTEVSSAVAQPEGRDFRIGIAALVILVFLMTGYLLYRSQLRKTNK